MKSSFFKSLICDIFIVVLQIGPLGEAHAQAIQAKNRVSDQEILRNSQVSYNADGGFTGVKSYGVIISCVNGKISVLKSIHDPHLSATKARTREFGTMPKDEYIALWKKLNQMAVFNVKDGTRPDRDIYDQFTVHFYAKLGKNEHQFQAFGISRPGEARYFAIRRLIDDSVQMQALWETYHSLSQRAQLPPTFRPIN